MTLAHPPANDLAATAPPPVNGHAWRVPGAAEPASLAREALALEPDLVATRRALHATPELGWHEFETTARIAAELAGLGYDVVAGRDLLGEVGRLGVAPTAFAAGDMKPGDTGCVATADSGASGPTVAIRVDIDALPIREAGERHRPADGGWASGRDGVMHACGHDGHAAIGLGLARLLKPRLAAGHGRVRLIFQPAEEGARGARSLVEAGLLDGVDLFLAVHVGLGVPSGTAAVGTTGFLATRKFDCVFTGRSAHAGMAPETGRNALLAAAQAAIGLHTLAQSGAEGVRLNVGRLVAGRATNIVPDRAEMAFEIRAGRQEALDRLDARARAMVGHVAAAHEVGHALSLTGEATDAETDPELAGWAAALADRSGLFDRTVVDHRFNASEDATLMMRAVQRQGGMAGYFVVGADLASAHHTPGFDFDERALARGVGLLAMVASSALGLPAPGVAEGGGGRA